MFTPRGLAACCLLPLLIAVPAASARPDPSAVTARFAAMNGPGWTGGDAALSVVLADGRTAWLWGDTFLGGVNRQGRRDPAAPMVRNSIVVEGRHGSMQTIVAGTPGHPDALVPGDGADDWYWPGPPVAARDTLQVPMAHIARTGPGGWDFRATGTALAVFALPELRLISVTPRATPPGVNMASALATSGSFTYVYGTRDAGLGGKDAFVARAPAGDLRVRWTYWTGQRWSPDPRAAVAILHGVSDQFSVLRRGHRWVLVTQRWLSRDIVAFEAGGPQGGWAPLGRIASTPSIPNAITYNATVHEQLSEGGRLMIGYCVIAADPEALWSDASLYRPRFMTARLPSSG